MDFLILVNKVICFCINANPLKLLPTCNLCEMNSNYLISIEFGLWLDINEKLGVEWNVKENVQVEIPGWEWIFGVCLPGCG